VAHGGRLNRGRRFRRLPINNSIAL
jgi:hypothetical protein